jgi:Zn-dependent protease
LSVIYPQLAHNGGRILVGILPKAAAASVARLEPYGLAILISLLIVLPLLGAQLGIDLSVVSRALAISTGAIIEAILIMTGNI